MALKLQPGEDAATNQGGDLMGQSTGIVFAIILLLSPVAAIAFAVLWRRSVKRHSASEDEAAAEIARLRARFDGIDDLDEEKARVAGLIEAAECDLHTLRADYQDKKATFDRLLSEIAIFDERIAFAEMGVYQPHFDYSDSDAYKASIETCREGQKAMISAKTAVFCNTKWSVDGSQSKGQTMTNRGIKLTLRAFNNECEAAIANTRWNNVNAMEKRITRAFEQINKLNASNAIFISDGFLMLRLEELRRTHEYREKLKAEREEKAEALRLAREEQRLLRDMEEAQEEEAHYARLLEKAKAEAAAIAGPTLEAFTAQIAILEKDLADAHARVERAQAMAERTRSGYVYIISNIGSFGEGVLKIGLTRRLDPMDRVRELGDASVPFVFDTHAIIYSDDAPALERALHSEFEPTRINAQNFRKEFFRAAIEDVEAAVQRLAPDANFFRDVEAQEYRETLSRRNQMLANEVPATQLFPAAL